MAKYYRSGRRARVVKALDGVSMEVRRGRPIGIAGESGSGKSTMMRLLLGLEPPTRGETRFESRDVADLDAATRRRYRGSVQAVFQDPGSSLDPRHRIWRSVTEPVWVAEELSRPARRAPGPGAPRDGRPPGRLRRALPPPAQWR